MNITRGCGLNGLVGTKSLSHMLYRPLLNFSKCELVKYAQIHALTYHDDLTNLRMIIPLIKLEMRFLHL